MNGYENNVKIISEFIENNNISELINKWVYAVIHVN